MKKTGSTIRIAAFAVATLFVTGATYALGSYSDAKHVEALAAAQLPAVTQPSLTAIAPVRIDVVGKRNLRTAV